MSDTVRDSIRARLLEGVLRSDAPLRTWFGHGQDHPCVACDRTIHASDRECEADFADGLTLRFHRECFYVWDDERQTALEERGPDETSGITAAILPEPLCLPCIVEKTGIPAARVRAFFTRVRSTVELTQARGECPECGLVTTTFRIG